LGVDDFVLLNKGLAQGQSQGLDFKGQTQQLPVAESNTMMFPGTML